MYESRLHMCDYSGERVKETVTETGMGTVRDFI